MAVSRSYSQCHIGSDRALDDDVVIIGAGIIGLTIALQFLMESDLSVAGKLEDATNVHVKPRKGHLLLLENFNSMKLNHGLMEVGYVNHQASASHHDEEALSVSMTSIMDIQGNLLLGSSRQFAGFSNEVDDSIVKCIREQASEFLPKLKELDLLDCQSSQRVRVGLRPYMPEGKPVIGPVPGLSNVLFATGHEGGGLSGDIILLLVLTLAPSIYLYDGKSKWTTICR